MAPTGIARTEDLLARAEWLRRLATTLVHDPEDLVQDTWVAAVRSPPRADGPPEPWLASVLRNLVRNRWRARRVRHRAVQLEIAATEPVSSPHELLERAQLQRVLAEMVLDLEEPYRNTILLRYYEGRNSTQIAREQGVPPGTVRRRLKEGIDRLRKRLDERHGGTRAAWMALLAPLTDPAARGVPVSAPWMAGKGAVLMAMSTKSKLAVLVTLAGLILTLAGGVAVWRAGSGRDDSGTRSASASRGGPALLTPSEEEARLPPATVQGEIRDPDGRAVAGAIVVLSRTTVERFASRLPAGIATSDRDGRFTFADARPGEHLVSASAAGFLAEVSQPFMLQAKEEKRILIALKTGGHTLTGSLLDEGGGPIAGARVSALITGSGGSLPPGPVKLFQTVTDGVGRYRIALSSREYTVRAEANGYAPFERTVAVTRPLQLDLRLHPAARITGSVYERESRRPVSGAEVVIATDNPFAMGSHDTTRTEEDGRFSFENVAAGQYQVRARRGTLLGVGPVLDLVATQTIDDVKLAMDPGVTVSGRLRDAAGHGVPGLQLALGDARATSQADGSFRLEGLLPGRERIGVSASIEGWKSLQREITIPAGGIEGVDLQVSRGGSLSGRVLTAAGKPAEGVALRADPEEGRGTASAPLRAESRADGTFRIAGFPEGRASILAWHPTLGAASQEVGPWSGDSAREVELRLAAAASISGVVRFADGSPAGAVSVAFTPQGGRGMTYSSVSTGDDGRFVQGGLLPGRYTVKARRKSGPWNLTTSTEKPDLRIVTLAPDEQMEGVDLVIPKGGRTIAGTVRLADGKPAEGTQVLAGRGPKPLGHMIEHSATVRVDGRFRVEDVEEGSFTLWALRPGFPDAQVENVAAGREDVKLRFLAPASVAGEVSLRDGRPLTVFAVNIVPTESAGESAQLRARRLTGSLRGRPVRDPAGTFEWNGLEAGKYDIKISTPDGAGTIQTVALATGERKQGLRLVVDSGIKVTGKAVDLDSGAPLPDMRVRASLSGRQLQTTTTADGAFELGGLIPGDDGHVRVLGDGGRISESKAIKVASGVTQMDLGSFRLMKGDPRKTLDGSTFYITVQNRDGRVHFLRVRPGSNAEKAGLKVGDLINGIDGRDVRGYGSGAIDFLLSRPVGASVSLIVQTPGQEPRSITVVAESMGSVPSPLQSTRQAVKESAPSPGPTR